MPTRLQVLVSNRPGTCHSLAGYHGIATQHRGSRDHHLFTLLSEELMSCETVSSAGREEEEWAATKASKPSKPISIKSHCSRRKMEKGGGDCESTSQGAEVSGYCIILLICCSHNSQARVLSQPRGGCHQPLLFTDVLRDKAKAGDKRSSFKVRGSWVH